MNRFTLFCKSNGTFCFININTEADTDLFQILSVQGTFKRHRSHTLSKRHIPHCVTPHAYVIEHILQTSVTYRTVWHHTLRKGLNLTPFSGVRCRSEMGAFSFAYITTAFPRKRNVVICMRFDGVEKFSIYCLAS